ncbi:MAG: hypothetical protein M3367_00515 [Acidobacteriota bacterium]|nr:hypothetical protein [Acidobacteriota bacterium]
MIWDFGFGISDLAWKNPLIYSTETFGDYKPSFRKMLLLTIAFGKLPRENGVNKGFCYNLGLVFGLLKQL